MALLSAGDGVPAVKRRRDSQWSAMTTDHNTGRVQSNERRRSSIAHLKKNMDDDETSLSDCHQDVSQSEARSQTQRGETWQRCRGRSIGTAPRAEGGENKEEQEGGQKTRLRRRRRMVGPPIRYLLESESWSHGPSLSNPCKDRGAKDQGSEAGEDSSRVGGGSQLCQVRAFHLTQC